MVLRQHLTDAGRTKSKRVSGGEVLPWNIRQRKTVSGKLCTDWTCSPEFYYLKKHFAAMNN